MKNKKTLKSLIVFLILSLLIIAPTAFAASLTESAMKQVGFLGLIALIFVYFPFASPSAALASLLKWLLSVFTFISVISFIVAGVMFMLSGSDPGLKEKAKSGVVYSIIGIATGLSGWVILNTIVKLMEASI